MNKKGVPMVKMIIFLIGSLIVGALVIFAFPNMVHRLMINAEEQVVAKDLGLTIMTISASPNNFVYRYDRNTENYEVRITQDEVQVKSKEGSGKYKYMQMIGVTVDDALIQNKLLIPITLKNGKLSFADGKISYSDVCSAIPSNFNEEIIKVRIDISYSESSQSTQKLDEIKSVMKMYATQVNSKVEFVDSGEDLLLILQTGSNPEVNYYTNMEDQTLSWYNKIACYINNGINSEEKMKKMGTSNLDSSSEESITISLGDTNKFVDETSKDARLCVRLSKMIYNAIGLGISD